MEEKFMGAATSKISAVYLQGVAAPASCIAGSFRFDAEDEWVSWRDSRGHHRIFADEVVGVSWSDE